MDSSVSLRWRKALWCLMSVALVMGFMSLPAFADEEVQGTPAATDASLYEGGARLGTGAISSVSYVERSWDGTKVVSETKTIDASPVPSDGSMTSGWYYLDSDVSCDARVLLQGDTHLILGDGHTLDVKGLYVPNGSTLTIYGQSEGENAGTLLSQPRDGAAIGGYSGHDNGSIVIHGGNIVADGYDNCAGIGSNDGKTGGPITIYGGTVEAKGGKDGAAIGGGLDCDGGEIEVYGGDITANGPEDSDTCENGAGIGGGSNGSGGTISIWGGTITAYSRDGAGIGGGDDGDGGAITIHGGKVTSTKVNQGQGARIGGGCDAASGTVTIHGGEITTVGGFGAGIGGGKRNEKGGSVVIDGGVIDASGDYGIGSGEDGADVAVTLGYTDATRESISIYASSYNGTVTLDKPFARYDGEHLSGTFGAGLVSNNIGLSGGYLKEWVQDDTPVEYTRYSWNEADKKLETSSETSKKYTVVTSTLFKAYPDGLTSGDYVVKENTTIAEYFYIRKGCTVNLIVPKGVTLTCEQGIGCGYDKDGKFATLNIYGEGKIVATGGSDVAGIGGKDKETNGNLTFHGVTIEATGGTYAAGIGGGDEGKDPDGTTSIKIYAGKMTIKGGKEGAGIGGGNEQPGAHTYIYGGDITARGGRLGAGIGGGDEEGTLGVFIYGGTVTATGGHHSAGIGAGEEGGNLRKKEDGGGVNILGGTVEANGGKYGAGIGGGFGENVSGTITIDGKDAKVDAWAGECAAGIGAGRCTSWSVAGNMNATITINAGDVHACALDRDVVMQDGYFQWDYASYVQSGCPDYNGAGIGAGFGGNMDGAVKINGGNVTVRSGVGAAGIGGGQEDMKVGGEGGPVYIGGGTIRIYTHTKGDANWLDPSDNEAIGIGANDDHSGSVYISHKNNETGRYMRVVCSHLDGDMEVEWTKTAAAGDRSSYCHRTANLEIDECPHKDHEGNSGLTYTIDSEDAHTFKCKYCAMEKTEEHSFVDGVCTGCGYKYKGELNTVSFEAGEGTGTMESVRVVPGKEYALPECDFTAPEGKEFAGWMIGETLRQPGDSITVNDDLTLTAQWAGCYRVAFDPGDLEGVTGEMEDVTVKEGVEYALPSCRFTAPEGYVFSGWKVRVGEDGDYASKQMGDKIKANANETVHVVAEWNTSCSVTLLPGYEGAEDDPQVMQFPVNGNLKLPECGFTTPDGMRFKEWSVVIGGAQAVAKAQGDTITVTANTTVTAVWETAVSPGAQVFGHTLSLDGRIAMNTYMVLGDDITAQPGNYQGEYWYDGKLVASTKVSQAEVGEKEAGGVTYTVHKFLVTSVAKDADAKLVFKLKRLSDKAYLDFASADGKTTIDGSEGLAYSIVDYLDDRIANSENEKMVQLAKDMKAYHVYAKHYFAVRDDGSTEPLPTVDGFVAETSLPDECSPMKPKVIIPHYFEYKGTSLELLSGTTFRYYFESEHADELTITVDGEKVEPKRSDSLWYVEVDDIAAQDLDEMHRIDVTGDGQRALCEKHGPLGYAKWAVEESGNENLRYLMSAIYHYNKAADAYFVNANN